MCDEQQLVKPEEHADTGRIALEFCFIVVVGLIVVAAFVTASGYEFVSARTPIVIMVPLIILIGMQAFRASKFLRTVNARSVLSAVFKGNNKSFNKTAGFISWMALLLALIVFVGHYAAVSIVMFVLLRLVSKEQLLFSLALTTGVTVLIFLLFELGFDIELHRGLISRILAGDFGL